MCIQHNLGEFSSQNFTHFAAKVRLLERLLEKWWRLGAFSAPVLLFSPWRLKVSTALIQNQELLQEKNFSVRLAVKAVWAESARKTRYKQSNC